MEGRPDAIVLGGMKLELVPTKPRQTYHIANFAFVHNRYSDRGGKVSLVGVAARGIDIKKDDQKAISLFDSLYKLV